MKMIPMIACSDVTIQKHFQELERTHLSKSQPAIMVQNVNSALSNHDITRPLKVISNPSSITRDYLDMLTQLQVTNGEKQSNFFQKIAKKYQRMILVVSSRGDVVILDMNE